MKQKIADGTAFRGKVKFNRFNSEQATIHSRVLNKEIIIQGLENINRSINGDIVAVELLDSK